MVQPALWGHPPCIAWSRDGRKEGWETGGSGRGAHAAPSFVQAPSHAPDASIFDLFLPHGDLIQSLDKDHTSLSGAGLSPEFAAPAEVGVSFCSPLGVQVVECEVSLSLGRCFVGCGTLGSGTLGPGREVRRAVR